MAPIERFIQDMQDLLAPVEPGSMGRSRTLPMPMPAGEATVSRSLSLKPAAADPVWFGPSAASTARWDWLEAAAPQQHGLEVSEHEVPAGWLVRTFGVAPALSALR